jgi:hypothetical protein
MDQMAASIKLHYLSINIRHYPIISTLLKPLAGILVRKEIIQQYMDYSQRAADKLNCRLSPDAAIERPDIVSQLRSEDRGEGLTPDEV